MQPIDPSLARGLARFGGAEWEASGVEGLRELGRLAASARTDICRGRAPAKVFNRSIADLERLAGKADFALLIELIGTRKAVVTGYVPRVVEHRWALARVIVELSGRNGAVEFRTDSALLISQHAVERLHQRLGVTAFDKVRVEVLSGTHAAGTLSKSAQLAEASSWPCPTANGLFVTANDADFTEGRFVTWMHVSNLGRRWSELRNDLNAAWNVPRLRADVSFFAHLLRMHGWLALQREGTDAGGQSAASRYVVGLNYSTSRSLPRVGSHSEALVLAVRQTGTALIVTPDGLFGYLPRNLSGRLQALVPGDQVQVEVSKIRAFGRGKCFSVLFAEASEAEQQWQAFAQTYPPGHVTDAVVLRSDESCLICQVPGQVPLLVANSELSWFESPAEVKANLGAGSVVRVKVTRVNDARRRLEGSLKQCTPDPAHSLPALVFGDAIRGTVLRDIGHAMLIKLLPGFSGLLPKSNIPPTRQLTIGEELELVVIECNLQQRRVELACAECISVGVPSVPLAAEDEDWDARRSR